MKTMEDHVVTDVTEEEAAAIMDEEVIELQADASAEDQAALEVIAAATSPTYQPDRLDVDVLKLLISRLAQLMAQEVDVLERMDILALGELQAEKKGLVDALEKQKKLLSRHQRLVDSISEEERNDLEELIDIFNTVMQENHKRLLIAREVNARVVQAITEMANQHAQHSYYTSQGQRADDPSVCLSLNRSI